MWLASSIHLHEVDAVAQAHARVQRELPRALLILLPHRSLDILAAVHRLVSARLKVAFWVERETEHGRWYTWNWGAVGVMGWACRGVLRY